MSDEIKELLNTLIKGQQKLSKELEANTERIESFDERLSKIESQIEKTESNHDLSPALIKALKAMIELDCPCSTQELAKHLDLSRNVVSMYLNQLERTGLIAKTPNLGAKKARYLFNVKIERWSEELRAFVMPKKRKPVSKLAAR